MSISGVGGGTSTGATGATRQNNITSEAQGLIKSARDQFMEYMKMTPAEKMQYAWLAARGISKEAFVAMSPADKQKLMDEMKREIEMKLRAAAENPESNVTKILG